MERKLQAIGAMATRVSAPTARHQRWQMETYSTKVMEPNRRSLGYDREICRMRRTCGKERMLGVA